MRDRLAGRCRRRNCHGWGSDFPIVIIVVILCLHARAPVLVAEALEGHCGILLDVVWEVDLGAVYELQDSLDERLAAELRGHVGVELEQVHKLANPLKLFAELLVGQIRDDVKKPWQAQTAKEKENFSLPRPLPRPCPLPRPS